MDNNEEQAKEDLTEEEYKAIEEDTEEFVKETFPLIWKAGKDELKQYSKKELAEAMYLAGVMQYMSAAYLRDKEMEEMIKNDPEKAKKLLADEFWAEGSFTETMSKEEMEQKKKTIHMKHDEDMNYNCKACNKKISAHNRDWHDGMCDECFNKKYYPDNIPQQNNHNIYK